MSLKRGRSTDVLLNNGAEERNVKAKMSDFSEQMKDSNKVSSMEIPSPGSKLADFESTAVIDMTITPVSKAHYEGTWLCLVFYGLDFTEESTITMADYSDSHQTFTELNSRVLFCSTDSSYSHLAWAGILAKQGCVSPPPLLSDSSHKITQSLGLLDQSTGISKHSFIIVDPESTIKQVVVSERPAMMAEVLATLLRHQQDE